jgi:hypothetical protein
MPKYLRKNLIVLNGLNEMISGLNLSSIIESKIEKWLKSGSWRRLDH